MRASMACARPGGPSIATAARRLRGGQPEGATSFDLCTMACALASLSCANMFVDVCRSCVHEFSVSVETAADFQFLVSMSARRKKPKRRRETKTSLKHARTAKHTGRVPRGTFYKCASVAATSASAPSSATARRANAEPLPVCLTCLHLDNVAQQLVVVLLRRRYAV